MHRVTVYSRPGCHLCDDVKAELERLRGRVAFELEVVNIDEDVELQQRFGEEIPVVFIDGRKAFKYRLDSAAFLKRLAVSEGSEGSSGI